MTAESWPPVEPATNTEPVVAFYEPWQPKVGDRVRLIPNGECPLHSSVSESLRGEAGTVTEVNREDNGHDYKVTIDRPELLPATWMALFGPWCAACELEPLSCAS